MISTVVYDASALHDGAVRDLLIRLSAARLIQAKWPVQVLDNLDRHLKVDRGINEVHRRDLRAAISNTLPDNLITGHELLSDTLPLGEPYERSVLAAAIKARADMIVSAEPDRYPVAVTTDWGIVAIPVDAFIARIAREHPSEVLQCVIAMAVFYHASTDFSKMIARLKKSGLSDSIIALQAARIHEIHEFSKQEGAETQRVGGSPLRGTKSGSRSPDNLARNPSSAIEVDIAEAEDFIRQHFAECPDLGRVEERLIEVNAEIAATGTYRHTSQELTFGARLAWRNSANCLGRLYWKSLKVRDLRDISDPGKVADECIQHIRIATNSGKIRPLITVFAPDEPMNPGPRIRNSQLVRYAAYRGTDGGVLGDQRNLALTDFAVSHGWRPPTSRSPFDVLPLIIETASNNVSVTNLPSDVVLEVSLTHPEMKWIKGLGLRWHAVSSISNMRMRIGGVDYPAAPFSAWHMDASISTKALAAADRYDLLPYIAKRMALDMSSEATLWRDRALVELARAVLHSFSRAGVTITDHHTEARRFLTHLEKEEAAGRSCPANPLSMIAPMSISPMVALDWRREIDAAVPNFFAAGDSSQSWQEGH
ncbi:nitric oxide synthase oxygenase [Lentzea sp. NPDC055074]